MTEFRSDWMWSEACEMLARAERMHREFFRPARTEAHVPAFEPPVDVLEQAHDSKIIRPSSRYVP